MKLVQLYRHGVCYDETDAIFKEGFLSREVVEEIQMLYAAFKKDTKSGNAGAGVGCMDSSAGGTAISFQAAESGSGATTGVRHGGKRINGLFAMVCSHGVTLSTWALTEMNENAGHHATAALVAASIYRYVGVHTLDLNCIFGESMFKFKQWLAVNPGLATDFVKAHYLGSGCAADRALGACPHGSCSLDDMVDALEVHHGRWQGTGIDFASVFRSVDVVNSGFVPVAALIDELKTQGVTFDDEEAFFHACGDPDWAGKVSIIAPLDFRTRYFVTLVVVSPPHSPHLHTRTYTRTLAYSRPYNRAPPAARTEANHSNR